MPVETPLWVEALIAQYQSVPVATQPRSIWRNRYQSETLYYISAVCCGQSAELRDARGSVRCAPNPITASSMRRPSCIASLGEPLERTLVWRGERPSRERN